MIKSEVSLKKLYSCLEGQVSDLDKKRKWIYTAAGFAGFAGISLLVFFFGFPGEKAGIDWWGLGSALFAEAVLFAGIGTVAVSDRFRGKKIVGAGFICCLFLYWVICVACTMLTRSIFLYHPFAFLVMQLILFVAVALVSTLLMLWVTKAEAPPGETAGANKDRDMQA